MLMTSSTFVLDDDMLLNIFGSSRLSGQNSQQSHLASPKTGEGSQDLFSSVDSSQGNDIDQQIDMTLQVCMCECLS